MNSHQQANSAAGPGGGRPRSRLIALAAAAAVVALAGGCAAGGAGTPAASTHATAPTPVTVEPGTPMKPDMKMPGTRQADAPSASAVMVCGPEIRGDVTKILAPAHPPTTTTTWTDHLYTCTYHLPGGKLVLSVKESPNTASANAYFDSVRKELGTTTQLTAAQGLGNPGYESAGGTVVILKDGKTLRVDATGMPTASGPHKLSRAELAYEVASDIVGCWSE